MATSTRSYPSPTSPTSHTVPFLQRKPAKKTSFLSLRKEKKQPDPPSSPTQHEQSPAAYSTFDLESSARPVISHPIDLKSHRSRSASKSVGSAKEAKSLGRGKDKHRHARSPPPEQDAFDFHGDISGETVNVPWPTSDDTETLSEARRRTHSGLSRRQGWEYQASLSRPLKYPYRDSGSSTLSHFDPLPQTPVDDFTFAQRAFSIPVVVAAPISGVETMDALVDGMNGSSEDDHFASTSALSSRSHFKKTGYHPLYHPPLPKPPPGVTLGLPRKSHKGSDSDSEVDNPEKDLKRSPREREKAHKSRSTRAASSTTVTRYPTFSMPSIGTSSSRTSLSSTGELSLHKDSYSDDLPSIRDVSPPPPSIRPSAAPSISDIIKTHAPACHQAYNNTSISRRTSYANSLGHTSTQHAESFELPSPTTAASIQEELELISRSSVDTIAEEVRQTIRIQNTSAVTARTQAQLQTRPHIAGPRPLSTATDMTRSPVSDGRRDSSLYNWSNLSSEPVTPAMDISQLTKAPIHSSAQMIAQYLRSSRLTTMLKLTRSPHASRDTPLNVSLSDLGSPTGKPVLVFLGLGCVRHIMGLYDEMAECMGIRLITIDRWGLGRTDSPRSKSVKGIPEWSTVVEEVLDSLQIDQCSVMAHSAGAPYALAFASRFPERVRGDICLLAPWVGGGENSYKWLKYVPNGILKTAQAAEWKVQAWMLGKPPSIAYEGIGFDVKASSPTSPRHVDLPSNAAFSRGMDVPVSPGAGDTERRSQGSGGFSDYDDLRDFDGRFESKSTLGRRSSCSGRSRAVSESKSSRTANRKPSKGFLGRLKGGGQSMSNPPTPQPDRAQTIGPAKRLKALRSMGSLKGRSSTTSQSAKKNSTPPSSMPRLPPSDDPDMGLGLDELDWQKTIRTRDSPVAKASKSVKSDGVSSLDLSVDIPQVYPRSAGRRSISFGASMARAGLHSPTPPVPALPPTPASPQAETPTTPGISYQASLGNALIAASHAESSRGTHSDLIQILNHDRQPWGFSYTTYPHSVRVWYGDRDERIAENAVRWMENTMGQDKCQVTVVKGADHALMFKSGVVIECLEYISECWRPD